MLGPSTAIWLRKMIVPHISGGRAPLESGLGAKPSYAGVTIAILGDWALLAQPRSKSAKPPKAGGQIVTDGGSHAPTRTRGRRSDLCSGSSELGGGGDGRLGFVTDASRGAIFGLLAPPPHPQCRPQHKIAAHSRIFRGLTHRLLVLHSRHVY